MPIFLFYQPGIQEILIRQDLHSIRKFRQQYLVCDDIVQRQEINKLTKLIVSISHNKITQINGGQIGVTKCLVCLFVLLLGRGMRRYQEKRNYFDNGFRLYSSGYLLLSKLSHVFDLRFIAVVLLHELVLFYLLQMYHAVPIGTGQLVLFPTRSLPTQINK